MAGGSHPKNSSNNNNKPSSSSSSHRKSRWESGNNAPAGQKAPAAGESKQPLPPPPPPPGKSKPSPQVKPNPSPKPNSNPSPNQPNQRQNPSPRPGPGLFPENLGPPPPPAYGFHMLDRRTILLADGSVRSYFALPPDYQDFTPPPRHPMDHPGRFMPHGPPELGMGFDRQFPPGGPIREDPQRHQNQDYWNSLGSENPHKRKFGDEGERDGRREDRDGKDEFARQRQQLLQYGNAGSNNRNGYSLMGAGPSSPYGRDVGELGRAGADEMRAAKYMRPDGEYGNLQGRHNVGINKHNEALKKAFLHYVKLINENATQLKNYLADGKQGPLQCLACSRSSKDFPDMHALVMHTHNSYSSQSDQLVQDHLGFHKALCILMGWNYSIPPDNSRAYRGLSVEEAAANRDDLIMWPPVVIIQNTITGKGRDGRLEGLGNKAMDNKLRDLGFSSGKSKSMYGREGHMGSSIVKFPGDQSGLKEAVRLAEYFEKENRGRRAWATVHSFLAPGKDDENNPNLVKLDKKTGENERIFYGYLGTVFDLDKVDFETRKKVAIESKREYKPAQ